MTEGKPVAICLDEFHQAGRFLAFECDKNDNWKGVMIPGARIELDETSLHDAEGHYAPKGSMLRFDDKLALRAQFERQFRAGDAAIVFEGLSQCAPPSFSLLSEMADRAG